MISEEIKESLRNLINECVRNNIGESVLFSGGIDSSILAYEALKYNKDLVAVTVGVENNKNNNSDFEYSTTVAEAIGLKNHHKVFMKKDELESVVYNVVRLLKTFNMAWVSAAMTLYIGCRYISSINKKTVLTGEGSDDIFGSFPGFLNWKGSKEELNLVLSERIKDIDIMTRAMAAGFELKCITPYHDEKLRNYTFNLPVEYRTLKEGNKIVSKYALRKAYEGYLPQICIERPQTMAFDGAGTMGLIQKLAEGISDEIFEEYNKKYFIFSNKVELYLFKIYNSIFGYKVGEKDNNCVYCNSKMARENAVHCRTCGTLQFKGGIIPF